MATEVKTNILSPELLLFVLILGALMKLRKTSVYSMSIAKGLVAYIPPTEKDFEVLEKSNAKPKTNMKGEPRPRDRR